jgi:hypothetical protein
VATDPRDKVFGLLGIARFEYIEPIMPDHPKTMKRVFIEATVAFLLESSAFPYFDFALNPPADLTQVSGMPSWAIDFTLHSKPYGSKEYHEGPRADMTAAINLVEESDLAR